MIVLLSTKTTNPNIWSKRGINETGTTPGFRRAASANNVSSTPIPIALRNTNPIIGHIACHIVSALAGGRSRCATLDESSAGINGFATVTGEMLAGNVIASPTLPEPIPLERPPETAANDAARLVVVAWSEQVDSWNWSRPPLPEIDECTAFPLANLNRDRACGSEECRRISRLFPWPLFTNHKHGIFDGPAATIGMVDPPGTGANNSARRLEQFESLAEHRDDPEERQEGERSPDHKADDVEDSHPPKRRTCAKRGDTLEGIPAQKVERPADPK